MTLDVVALIITFSVPGAFLFILFWLWVSYYFGGGLGSCFIILVGSGLALLGICGLLPFTGWLLYTRQAEVDADSIWLSISTSGCVFVLTIILIWPLYRNLLMEGASDYDLFAYGILGIALTILLSYISFLLIYYGSPSKVLVGSFTLTLAGLLLVAILPLIIKNLDLW